MLIAHEGRSPAVAPAARTVARHRDDTVVG